MADDGWEEVTDPTELKKVLGVNGMNRILKGGAEGSGGGGGGEIDTAAVRAEAIDKIKLARSLQQRSRDGWFTTGFGSGAAGWLRGTPAYDLAQDTETLKNAGALTRIMEMSRTNGGKNPLTPLSNSDFQALASSLSNLDTGQSDEQYQANVQRVIDLYSRAYAAAGGTDLEGDIDPSKRPKQEPAAPGISAPIDGGGGPGGGGAPTIGPDGTPQIASGQYRTERDDKASALVDQLIRQNVPAQQAFKIIQGMGYPAGLNLDQYQAAQRHYRQSVAAGKPFAGSYGSIERQVEQTGWQQFAASPLGTGIYAAVDAGLGGLTDEIASAAGGGDLADLNARKQAAFAANPKSAVVGQVGGTIAGMAGLGALGRSTGLATRFANPQLAGDLAFGAFSGAGQSNDNRLLGAAAGTAGGGLGNLAGNGLASAAGAAARTRPGMALTNRARGIFGAPVLPNAAPLAEADRTILNLVQSAGIDDVTAALREADNLRVPMSLADTHPSLRELTGAAVRRSPNASSMAEDALLPRARGQYDRFASSVDRNLGPTANIPELSADLSAQARAGAADLYDQAYAAPGVSSPEIDTLLQTPFGRQALSRARTIAANERRDPTSMGFDLDAQGEVVLTRVPSMQTLDYVKRGMDDVLEEQRNPITGRLTLDEAGRAQNDVRQNLLREMDRLNPTYRDARAAYAGPMASRDALARGGDAYRLHPDELGMQVAGQTPEQLGQMQLGYRGAMVDHAGRIRDSSNPWDATISSPVSRDRLTTMYPGNPGADTMIRQAEMERQLAQTANAILGNSRTAQRQIADDAFMASSPLVESSLHAGAALATGGASLPGTLARVAGMGVKNWMTRGQNRMSEARAEALVPQLLNTNPSASLDQLMNYLAQQRQWQSLVTATTPRQSLGMFGRGVGSQAATMPLNQQ